MSNTDIKDKLIDLNVDIDLLLSAEHESNKEYVVVDQLEIVEFDKNEQYDKRLDDIKADLSQFGLDIVEIVLTSKNEKERDIRILKHINSYAESIAVGGY